MAYIDTSGNSNSDGGDVTITGPNDITFGYIITQGGEANDGGEAANNQGIQQGTAGNDAGKVIVTAGEHLEIGLVEANGSDAWGYQNVPVFKSEEAAQAAKDAGLITALNGGNGGEVTLTYGETVGFTDGENYPQWTPEGLTRATLPEIINPNPMIGLDGTTPLLPENHIQANGGLGNFYGIFVEFDEVSDNEAPQGIAARSFRVQRPLVAYAYLGEKGVQFNPLGQGGVGGQISILGPVTPTTDATIPNARLAAGFTGELNNIPGVTSVEVDNVGATAAGGENGEGCEAEPGSNNPNVNKVLNFGAELPGHVTPSC